MCDAVSEFPRDEGTEYDRTHYNIAMHRYHKKLKDQVCSWFHTVDVAAFVREEDEAAVRRDQERMSGHVPAADTPTVKAQGAVYVTGRRHPVPEASIPKKWSWFNDYGRTRHEQLENWLLARRRIEREHNLALHRGQKSKMEWRPVEERSAKGKGKKGKSGKKGKG